VSEDYYQGAQDGYKVGYNVALIETIDMLKEKYPEIPNLYNSGTGLDVIESIQEMMK
jgi:hypothetical protein